MPSTVLARQRAVRNDVRVSCLRREKELNYEEEPEESYCCGRVRDACRRRNGERAKPVATAGPIGSRRSAARETTISGELMRVNPDTKMFTVKAATGEIQFEYSDQTVVTGAQKTVAGLATMSGEQVTVSFRAESGANIATKIEVREKK